jgi:hypothetical protein
MAIRILRAGAWIGGLSLMAAATSATAGEIDDLKAQVEALRQRVDELQTSQVPTLPVPQRVAAPASEMSGVATIGSFPGSLLIPGTTTSVKLGGYAKLDAFYDVGAKGAVDIQDATQVPLSGTVAHDRRNYAHMDAKYSNINIESHTPTDYGEFIVYAEMDFAGATSDTNVNVTKNGYTPRLRHAYGKFGNLLAGQTNTTFRDIASDYESLDSGDATGISAIRQAQIRYTFPLGEKTGLSVAIENPETDYSTSAGVKLNGTNGGLSLSRLPDFVTAMNSETGWGHWNVRGMVRELRIVSGTGLQSSAIGWGIGASVAATTWGQDKVIAQAHFGDGIGRYITDASGQAAVQNPASGALETRQAWGLNVGYQHWWIDGLRSNFDAGMTRIASSDLLSAAGADVYNHTLMSAAANLIWSPIPRIDTGIEYLFGHRVTAGGPQGNQHRVLVSFRWKF